MSALFNHVRTQHGPGGIKETKKIKAVQSCTSIGVSFSIYLLPTRIVDAHRSISPPISSLHRTSALFIQQKGRKKVAKIRHRNVRRLRHTHGMDLLPPLSREPKQRLLALASYEQQSSNWSDQGSPVLVSPRRMSEPFAALFRRSKGPVFYFNLLVRRTAHDQQLGGLVSLPFMRAMPSIPSSLLDLRADTTFIRP